MSKEALKDYLKLTKDYHFNNTKTVDYVVSTGSLILDAAMGGGVHPGIVRFSGVTEGGKTSAALSLMHNFLKEKGRKGLYIKSEGRFSKFVQARAGIKFTRGYAEWEEGTCFVFETNIYETAVGLIDRLAKSDEDTKYFFIVDSVDSLIRVDDLEKSYDETLKVGGGAVLASVFLKKMSLVFATKGHVCLIISQVRSNIKIDPYAKSDPMVTNATGGNALLHYSDWILEFQPRAKLDLIVGDKDKNVGHFCKVIFKKTQNEKTGDRVLYPIKYGQENAQSVWKSFEIADLLLGWEMVTQAGAWIKFKEETIKLVKEAKLDIPQQFQGIDNFRNFFDENPKATEYFTKYFTDRL